MFTLFILAAVSIENDDERMDRIRFYKNEKNEYITKLTKLHKELLEKRVNKEDYNDVVSQINDVKKKIHDADKEIVKRRVPLSKNDLQSSVPKYFAEPVKEDLMKFHDANTNDKIIREKIEAAKLKFKQIKEEQEEQELIKEIH